MDKINQINFNSLFEECKNTLNASSVLKIVNFFVKKLNGILLTK